MAFDAKKSWVLHLVLTYIWVSNQEFLLSSLVPSSQVRNVLSATWIFVRSLPATVIIEVHPSESNGRIYQLCTSSRCYNRTPRSIPFFSSKVDEVNIVARAS